jgi:hypothetical protein
VSEKQKDPWLVRTWPHKLYHAPKALKEALRVDYVGHPGVRYSKHQELIALLNEDKLDNLPDVTPYVAIQYLFAYIWGITLPWGLFLDHYLKYQNIKILETGWQQSLLVMSSPIWVGLLIVLTVSGIELLVKKKEEKIKRTSKERRAASVRYNKLINNFPENKYPEDFYLAGLGLKDIIILRLSRSTLHIRSTFAVSHLMIISWLAIIIVQLYFYWYTDTVLRTHTYTEMYIEFAIYFIPYTFLLSVAFHMTVRSILCYVPTIDLSTAIEQLVKDKKTKKKLHKLNNRNWFSRAAGEAGFILFFIIGLVVYEFQKHSYSTVTTSFFGVRRTSASDELHFYPSVFGIMLMISLIFYWLRIRRARLHHYRHLRNISHEGEQIFTEYLQNAYESGN